MTLRGGEYGYFLEPHIVVESQDNGAHVNVSTSTIFSSDSENNNFFDVGIAEKKSKCGSVWSVLLLMICVITVVKICCGLPLLRLVSVNKILTPMMMHIVANKSTDHTKQLLMF